MTTDFNGSPIVILSEEEARCIHARLLTSDLLSELEQRIIYKITTDLNLEQT